MDELEKIISSQKKQLNNIEQAISSHLATAPPGTLEVHTKTLKSSNPPAKKAHYYHAYRDSKNEFHRKYIREDNMLLAQQLAQKKYENKLIVQTQNQLKAINAFESNYNPRALLDVYNSIPDNRQSLVKPLILSDELYAQKWLEAPYETKGFSEDDTNIILTLRGERVRSKSEKILADCFHSMGVPYRYEPELKLKGFGTVHPDFLLLNSHTRKEYYWEHFGLLDNPQYIKDNMYRIEAYANNGIFIGKQILFSFETRDHTINMSYVQNLINAFLL